MKALSKILLGGAIFAQLSCITKKDTPPIESKTPDLFALTQEFKVICHDEESCSPSVGNFIIYDVKENPAGKNFMIKFGNCTASLIGPDTVITNRHCFINQQAKVGDDCSNIFIKFPKVQQHSEEIHQCGEILFRPDITITNEDEEFQNMDVAILKLKTSSARPPLKISTVGFKNNEMVTIHRFSTQGNTAYLEALHCPVVQDAALLPIMRLASHPYSAFIYLSDCPIVESNSGSPIMDSQSAIKGVINMYIDSEKVKSLFKAAEKFKNAGRGMNLACVDHPLVNPQKVSHPECLQTLDFAEQPKWIEQRLKELHINRFDLAKETYADYYQKAKSKFTWNYTVMKTKGSGFLDFLALNQRFWFVPKCVKSEEELKDFYQSTDVLPIFLDDSTFDEAGRLNEKIKVEAYKIKSIETRTSGNNVFLEVSFFNIIPAIPMVQDIPLCTE